MPSSSTSLKIVQRFYNSLRLNGMEAACDFFSLKTRLKIQAAQSKMQTWPYASATRIVFKLP